MYDLPVSSLASAPDYAVTSLWQYHGVKLGYEDAKDNLQNITSSRQIFYMRSRTDLYLDSLLMNSILHQLESQKLDEIAFSGTNFGNGLRDFMWLSSPSCSDSFSSVIQSICKLFNAGFFPPAEVCLKLHADRSMSRFTINRNLPCILIGIKNGRLYKRNSASWARRCAALLTPDYVTVKPLVPHDNPLHVLYQSAKGYLVDRRVSHELAKRNQRIYLTS